MPTRKSPSSRTGGSVKRTAGSGGGASGSSRPAPVKKVPVQAAPHSKTLANGKPRPKRRG